MDTKLSQQDIKRYNWYIWRFFIGGFAFVVLLVLLTSFGLFGPLPSFRDLENPKSNLASEVYSEDKVLLGKYFFTENRSRLNYDQISPNVVNALIATEDNHFYSHSGIDFWRTFSIIFYNLIGKKQGASTISQQLALNLFSEDGRKKNIVGRFFQKLTEQITAIRIEKHYTKKEILTMYLNTVEFSSNTKGIESAAQVFFNKHAADLTPEEAALLIGQLKATDTYSPIKYPENALTRRNFILGRMASEGYLDDDKVEEFRKKPIGIDFHPLKDDKGLAPYFRNELRKELTILFREHGIVKGDGSEYDFERDGLKIYTTINSSMQKYAEEAQIKHMQVLQKLFIDSHKGYNWKKSPQYKSLIENGMRESGRYADLQKAGLSEEEIRREFDKPVEKMRLFTWNGDTTVTKSPIDSVVYSQILMRNSLMSMDPKTGYVKAWVGGINFEYDKYDQVKAGKRQVGSTAKPFTYAVGLIQGYGPCYTLPNTPDTIRGWGEPWAPASSARSTIAGNLTLRKALANSQNWITARVMGLVTPPPVEQLIRDLGIKSKSLGSYPSIALGAFDASVMDMTAAYSAFANHGIWTEPTYLLRIEDKSGNVIWGDRAPKVTQPISEETAYVMTDMLKSVVKEGTAKRLGYAYGLSNAIIAGKTGTTNNNSDGWFIGMTPQLVTGVWTGFKSRNVSFSRTGDGEGANVALPIFAYYMKAVYADPKLGIKKDIDFERPKKPLETNLDCSTYTQQQSGADEPDSRLKF
ncbi:MAG: penicillin-binding protein [Sphingobacteriaceae bacterium]|nr:MAG: penicillin-binding protein [Sphingobacteriaceae bacterium]